MVEIELTQGFNAIVDDCDFEALSHHRWFAVVVSDTLVYAATKIRGNTAYMHNILMPHDKQYQVDHYDWNGLNNVRANLRIVSCSSNMQNRRKLPGTTSKYLGVCKHFKSGKWHAQIKFNHVKMSLGYFDNEEEAAKVYDAKALELHGERARTNVSLGLL